MATFSACHGWDCSGRLAQVDLNDRQVRIIEIMSACNLDLNIGSIAGANRSGLGQLQTRWETGVLGRECRGSPRFGRRKVPQGAVRTLRVVPIGEIVQPTLNAPRRKAEECETLPEFECPEKPLDFSVQKWCPYPRVHMADMLPVHRFFELLAELATVVGDDELRSAMSAGGATHQRGHIPCARRSGVHFQSQNLARKPIQNRRDITDTPEHTNLRHVAMPDTIGFLRRQQVMRLDADRFPNDGPWFSRRIFVFRFPQHSLDAGPADLNSSPQEVPGHGAGSEFRFRAEPSQFLRRPAYGVIHAIPDDGPGQQVRLAVVLDGFDPRAERIFVNHEPYSTRAIA